MKPLQSIIPCRPRRRWPWLALALLGSTAAAVLVMWAPRWTPLAQGAGADAQAPACVRTDARGPSHAQSLRVGDSRLRDEALHLDCERASDTGAQASTGPRNKCRDAPEERG